MKKFYIKVLPMIAMMAGSMAFGQSQRLVLVEHFTQASCGPCASQNPTLENTLNNNTGDVIAIKHQVSWPGTDPMNAAYPAGPGDRRNYYGITGVPNTVLDGTSGPGAPNTIVTNSTIANRASVASPFDVTVSHTITNGVIDVDVDVTCTDPAGVSGNLRLHIAVVEHEVIYQNPPGSNGETEFYNVLRRMLPSTSGTTITSTWAQNDNASYNETWTIGGYVANPSQLAVVAFIQDNSTMEVHQAGYSAPTPQYTVDAEIFDVVTPSEACSSPSDFDVTIVNNGATTLTSADIEYTVNGGSTQTYNWTGNLPFLGNATVTIPVSYTMQATNTIDWEITNLNSGLTDDNMANNTRTDNWNEAATAATNSLTLTIVQDNYGSETTWEVRNSGGSVVASGPSAPFSDGNNGTSVDENITVAGNDCYTFTIFDSYGDGICCAYGNGSYTLTDGSTTLFTGGAFADEESRYFQVGPVGIEENDAFDVSVLPNPTDGMTQININSNIAGNANILVMDNLGRIVRNDNVGLSTGFQSVNMDFSDLEAGLYILNINADNNMTTVKVIVK